MPPLRNAGVVKAWRGRALVAGLVALAISAAAVFMNRPAFFHAYLTAWIFWNGISLGSLGVLLLNTAAGGRWGVEVRRVLEAAARTLPLNALLFIPIAFGLKDLYLWARPEVVAQDPLLQFKSRYLNVPFFLLRSAFYFAVWIVMAFRATRFSLEQDRERSLAAARRLKGLSGPGLIIYVLTMTLAAVDWLMSLDPHWFSTIFGAILVAEQVLSALAFCVIASVLFLDHARREPYRSPESPLYDLGNMLLAFVMIWAYLAFSQFLIIWAGNLPEEIPWYLRRLTQGWQVVALGIILLHFSLPFVLLIFRGIKRSAGRLGAVAGLVLFMRLVETTWIVAPAPNGNAEVPGIHWANVTLAIGLGGLWFSVFLTGLLARADVRVHDLHEIEGFEHARA